MPTNGQLSLLVVSIALLLGAGVTSMLRQWYDRPGLRIAGKSCLYWGIGAAVGVLVWHSARRGSWMPVDDNFDALIWLAVLLAAFVAYVQGTRPLAALDWFVLPIVVILLGCAAVFGRTDFHVFGQTDFHPYVAQTWATVHRISSYGGAVAFAIAAAGGAMYVIASKRLRAKQPVMSALGSLERLERLTLTAVTLGFALLTIGIITGAVEMFARGQRTDPTKVILAAGVWVVYAVVLHAPINPVFRGRRAAALSVIGFILMIGAVVAAEVSR